MTRTQPTELSASALRKAINKKWGEGTITTGADPSLLIKRIPTGVLSVDYLTGGGFALGRHTEIYGSYSAGKTYLSYRAIASAQAQGLQCAFIDVESSYDPEFAAHAGVDLEALDFHRQKHGNQVIDFMETLLRSGEYAIICMDSIAALLPKSELEQDMEAGSFGTAQAKLMSAALRRLTAANRTTALLYINQTREAVGSMFKRNVTSGGRAMGFYAGTRLELAMAERIKRKARTVDVSKGDDKELEIVKAHRVIVRVEKDKTGGAKPYDEATFVFDYELGGIDPIEDIIYVGRRLKLIHKSNNMWWVEGYEDEKMNGRKQFRSWLRKNKAVMEELEEQAWEAIAPSEE